MFALMEIIGRELLSTALWLSYSSELDIYAVNFEIKNMQRRTEKNKLFPQIPSCAKKQGDVLVGISSLNFVLQSFSS